MKIAKDNAAVSGLFGKRSSQSHISERVTNDHRESWTMLQEGYNSLPEQTQNKVGPFFHHLRRVIFTGKPLSGKAKFLTCADDVRDLFQSAVQYVLEHPDHTPNKAWRVLNGTRTKDDRRKDYLTEAKKNGVKVALTDHRTKYNNGQPTHTEAVQMSEPVKELAVRIMLGLSDTERSLCRMLRGGKMTPEQIADKLDLSRATIYRMIAGIRDKVVG